jgi:hypothetical protein
MTPLSLTSGDSASRSDTARPCLPRPSFIAGYLRSTGKPLHGRDGVVPGLHELEAEDQA